MDFSELLSNNLLGNQISLQRTFQKLDIFVGVQELYWNAWADKGCLLFTNNCTIFSAAKKKNLAVLQQTSDAWAKAAGTSDSSVWAGECSGDASVLPDLVILGPIQRSAAGLLVKRGIEMDLLFTTVANEDQNEFEPGISGQPGCNLVTSGFWAISPCEIMGVVRSALRESLWTSVELV